MQEKITYILILFLFYYWKKRCLKANLYCNSQFEHVLCHWRVKSENLVNSAWENYIYIFTIERNCLKAYFYCNSQFEHVLCHWRVKAEESENKLSIKTHKETSDHGHFAFLSDVKTTNSGKCQSNCHTFSPQGILGNFSGPHPYIHPFAQIQRPSFCFLCLSFDFFPVTFERRVVCV